MYNLKRFFTIFLSVLLVIAFLPQNAYASSSHATGSDDSQQIKKLINDYFEVRYQSINQLKRGDFSSLITDPYKSGKNQKELDKLDLEIYHANLFQLQYLSYKIYLDFGNLSVDLENNTASVDVVEGRDVVFEVSSPTVSKMRDIHHVINLLKEGDVWRIESDQYEDGLWDAWNSSRLSKSDFQKGLKDAHDHYKDPQQIPATNLTNNVVTAYSTRAYNGLAAASYADTYWQNYNPAYYNFNLWGGDCTNFVSQAMHEGDGAPMDSVGWYYTDEIHHSTSWTGVPQLYDFLYVHNSQYSHGPSGVAKSVVTDLTFGDIIQYDWEPDSAFDHSVIVDGTQSNGMRLVASHNPDMIDTPYTYRIYSFPNETYHFVHIAYVKY